MDVDGRLFKDLASLAPVQLLMPPQAVPVYMQHAESGFRDLEHRRQLRRLSPVIALALESMTTVPASVHALLSELCDITRSTLTESSEARQIRAPVAAGGSSELCLGDGMFIPHGPTHSLPTYAAVWL